VLLCPDLLGRPEVWAHEVATGLREDGVSALTPELPSGEPGEDDRTARAHWVGSLAVSLTAAAVSPPVLLVLAGATGPLASALGLSQRAARRPVAGYVLLDAACPRIDGPVPDWPDAPVAYLASPDADALEVGQSRLRGWQIVQLPDRGAPAITQALRAVVAR
jgi:hypothetical protein